MQADTRLKELHIIKLSAIVSGHHAGMFPADAYLAVDAWLSKPIAPQTLLDTAARLLPCRHEAQSTKGTARATRGLELSRAACASGPV